MSETLPSRPRRGTPRWCWCKALFLLLIPLFAPALGHIPRAVIGALVFYAGTQLFDRWSLELVKRVFARKAVQWRSVSVDLGVIVAVAAIALAGNIMAAVLVGVSIAVVVFMLRMSRAVIRRERLGDAINSRRAREASDGGLLVSHGRAILAIELEGPLFFASAELLFNRIDAAPAEGVRYVILDLARVTELDSTGARILMQADERLRSAKCRLVLCGADARPELLALLVDHGVAEAFTHERMFRDLDHALEWCENDLLATLRSAVDGGEYPFERLDLLRGIAGDDREALRAGLSRREYAPGDVVFRQADEGDALYLIARGSASVWFDDAATGGRRLVTFSQGTFFGEMALLDRETRSATVTADDGLVCYVLERAGFDALSLSHPHAIQSLLLNMGRELSLRMRRANRALSELA
ncbi:MAG TPA: cyclic nucleotide-binding domain-containing protein [Usitatibacter sp.]|nr:cyclic nucleotide-binding domain-containing protein [Usitatibacter sp.]